MADKTIDDPVNHILWQAITQSVTASTNAPDGVVDTSDISGKNMREAKQALLAAIDESLPKLNDLPDYEENHPDKWIGFRDGVIATQKAIHALFGKEQK